MTSLTPVSTRKISAAPISRSIPGIIRNPVYLTGLIMLGISLILYHVDGINPAKDNSSPGGLFLFNYIFPLVFMVILLAKGSLRRGRDGIHPLFLFLVLMLVSAYALNTEIPVFEKSVTWFAASLVIVCVNYIAFVFFENLPVLLRKVMVTIAGIAIVLFAYLAIYLVPLYAMSILAIPALGISLHTFTPVLFFIFTLKLIRKQNSDHNNYLKPFIAGILLAITFTGVYVVSWKMNLQKINNIYRNAGNSENNKLPAWVTVAQQMPYTAISEKILKTELVYAVPKSEISDFFWRMPRMNNFEINLHDPLVMISTLLCGPVAVPEDDRMNILKSLYGSRHQAQDRLWSGKNLVTERIDTRVKLWPELRIGYTELVVVTAHTADSHNWTRNEEAIYTFHLPEGGVVTSLSLWIEGKEEKGILTTKAKADSAYKTIVGVESRDPSVVHWQEGNSVSVRVFPVIRGENRKFKLGITAPLEYDGKNVHYRNIHFEGPGYGDMYQSISLDPGSNVSDAELPLDFKIKNNQAIKEGRYADDWSVSLPAPPLSEALFSFNGYSYNVAAKPGIYEQYNPSKVYLDINTSWTQNECERIYDLVKHKEVYVYDNENLVAVNDQNKKQLFKEHISRNFSLFPFYKIEGDNAPLVISKSAAQSPTIDDLKKSTFIMQATNAFTANKSIHVFHLGTQLSPYLKSLKEFRAFKYQGGDEDELREILSSKQFSITSENDDVVAVQSAGIQIVRSNTPSKGSAPDHLMRLFAYNHVLHKAGLNVLAENLNDTALIKEAEQAYIVSPFSSLVVLETQKDYDRFGIEASKNSLQNASLKSKGAVPEPHEWALIALVILLLAALKFHPRLIFILKK